MSLSIEVILKYCPGIKIGLCTFQVDKSEFVEENKSDIDNSDGLVNVISL